ncbi:MAG: hypothetical protein KJO50_02120 [Bacteroidia bacterium]|nr:hypothetical protein [Bacteroidia bacterium]MBT8229027.1 hypothetical protein [Bacteroidia bacterium]NNK89730.1 hypothetical protein [Saprospiraceae bacterium]
MDLSNISKIIKKINRLYEIVENIGEASQTEKDLLKAYIVDLYESVVISPDDKDLEREEMLKKIKKQRKAEKKLKKLLGKEVEKVEVKEKENIYEEPKVNGEDQNKEEKAEIVKIAETVPPELVELFKFEKVTELSDKLSQKPVPDLKKAMGINERIFTINELFGGDKDEFENLLTALNGLENFDQAKDVLMNSVAKKYLWQKEDKQNKARNFIKLVQRRYN